MANGAAICVAKGAARGVAERVAKGAARAAARDTGNGRVLLHGVSGNGWGGFRSSGSVWRGGDCSRGRFGELFTLFFLFFVSIDLLMNLKCIYNFMIF